MHFGAIMLENKAIREVNVAPFQRESISLSFVPLKPGLIEVNQILLKEKKTGRIFSFDCQFNLLIA